MVENMEKAKIYEDIALRTDGDIYIGVVGPVRTGKSTFIKRFMETQVIPNIDNVYRRERAKDELPQSGSGRTIMTAEPKFVPEEAVEISLDDGAKFSVRLIDCVGYMVDGASGQNEGGEPRMVTTPWFPHEIPMKEAAEVGTRKVIAEHSTIGIVITTDGSITDIPRSSYVPAEERVIGELREIGKPFIVLLNSVNPNNEGTKELAGKLTEKYGVNCVPVNCMQLDESAVTGILRAVLYEFPMRELDVFLPPWVDALDGDHPLKTALFTAIRESAGGLDKIRGIDGAVEKMNGRDNISNAKVEMIDLGTGVATARIELPHELFYQTLADRSGFSVADDGDLMSLMTELAKVKKEYDKVKTALADVREKGYGIVVPTIDELTLEEPEIVKQGGRYGVRLKASAPSIHMIRADIKTSVSPVIGNEKQSEQMMDYLLEEFQSDTSKIWQSNIFGRSFNELVSEDLQTKLKHMPDDAQHKLQETLQRIINEGSGGLICIIL